MCRHCGCPAKGNEQIKFYVVGMIGLACVCKVRKTLLRLPGVYHIHIDADTGLVMVDYNPNRISVGDMERALSVAGYGMALS